MKNIMYRGRVHKVQELVEKYVPREPGAVKLIYQLLATASVTIETLTVQNLGATDFDHIERIDRLTAIAESRRNASLREIDRHRAALAQTPRPIIEHIKERARDQRTQNPGKPPERAGQQWPEDRQWSRPLGEKPASPCAEPAGLFQPSNIRRG